MGFEILVPSLIFDKISTFVFSQVISATTTMARATR